MKTFGKRLQELRLEKGLTQEELGRLVGVSAQAVSKWETNRNRPTVVVFILVCEELAVLPSELLKYRLKK